MQRYTKITFISLWIGILLIASFLRLYGINWDDGNHLHPDERFLTMVATSLQWPTTFAGYLNTDTSTLNPHNVGHTYYVYGTWPIIIVKYVGEILHRGTYDALPYVGRIVSVLFDMGTVLLVFAIARILKPSYKDRVKQYEYVPFVSMSLYASAVLPIQLSHFFTVDPYMVFFITLSCLFSLKLYYGNTKKWHLYSIALGISFGLAVAAKIQALLFAGFIIGIFIMLFHTHNKLRVLTAFALSVLFAVATMRLAMPYLFLGNLIPTQINSKVLENWKSLSSYYDAETYKGTTDIFFPPATGFIHAPNYLFPLENILLWGSGLGFGFATIIAIFYLCITRIRLLKHKALWPILLLLLWIIGFFIYQGGVFAKYLRYFYILYPFFAIVVAITIFETRSRTLRFLWILLALLMIGWTIAFTYSFNSPHPRVAATKWIYDHIPKGALISYEHWDDPLPLCVPEFPCGDYYTRVEFPLYEPDTLEKWQKLEEKLTRVDYIILSSNRVYGSIMTVPERLPRTNAFYEKLFKGTLGFTKIAEFTRRPNIPIPFIKLCLTPPNIWYGKASFPIQSCDQSGITFVDDYADESFTVYDHPKVIIFQNTQVIKQ